MFISKKELKLLKMCRYTNKQGRVAGLEKLNHEPTIQVSPVNTDRLDQTERAIFTRISADANRFNEKIAVLGREVDRLNEIVSSILSSTSRKAQPRRNDARPSGKRPGPSKSKSS